MRLLLETHVLIWAVHESIRLGPTARRTIGALDTEVFLSAASVWEIAIKEGKGALHFPLNEIEAVRARMRLAWLPIQPSHAIAAGRLPRLHGDPFDRMLIAQAQLEALTLVSDDPAIAHYDVPLLSART